MGYYTDYTIETPIALEVVPVLVDPRWGLRRASCRELHDRKALIL